MSEALINGLAGAGGGIVAQLLTYPLLTVNTRQQTERSFCGNKENTGTIERIYQIVQREGWNHLYGGLMPSLVGTAASQGVYYYLYEIFRSRAKAAALDRQTKGIGDGSVGIFSSLGVAALAGCLNVLLTNPIWVVVTRMQTHIKSLSPKPDHTTTHLDKSVLTPIQTAYGTNNVVQEVYDEAGLWGFWKGVFPTLIMVSNPSIQFMLYETMLKKLKVKVNDVKALEIFVLGALAKLGATVVTYPLLVVKSRLQAKQASDGDKKHNYEGTLDAMVKMVGSEGVRGFYKGMRTKIMQSVLAAAVLFMVKEELVRATRLMLLSRKGRPAL